jgi:GNAT superfamily N-acetyltransferase
MNQFVVERSKAVTARQIMDLRESGGSTDGTEALWQRCIEQSLCVVCARDKQSGELIGVAFVSGNARHAQLCDGVVKPNWRGSGVGGAILDEMIAFVRAEEISYVGLTFDTKSPWLKDFYSRHGFLSVDFAMWLVDSLNRSSAPASDANGEPAS